MAKHKNQIITNSDQQELIRLKEEYEMIGRQTRLEKGQLTVFALPQKRKINKGK
jgi:hypothetical protein